MIRLCELSLETVCTHTTISAYGEELEYLVEYAHQAPVYFYPLRDSSEAIVAKDSTEEQIQEATLRLIEGMLERGMAFGDMSPNEGENIIPRDLPRAEILQRVRAEMKHRKGPMDFINICWFVAADPTQ